MNAALRPTIIGRGVVFAGAAGGEHSSANFPSVCALAGGRWLCGFRAVARKADVFPQHFLLTQSDDAGRRWSRPVEPFAAPKVDGKPGTFRSGALTALGGSQAQAVLYWVDCSDPARPFFNERTEGLLDSLIFLSRSNDNGATWTPPQRVNTAPFNMPTPITGPLLLMRNGEWALQFETNKSYDDPSPWVHASVLMFSRDGGLSWPEHVKVSEDPEGRFFYWDQRPTVLADGSLLDVFWTFDRRKSAYLNLHARTSLDHGRTWSPIRDIGVPGQAGTPVPLADGRIVLPYMDRTGVPMLKVRVSADGGRSWSDSTEAVLDDSIRHSQQRERTTMQETWSDMDKFSIGLPTGIALADGSVLLVYYGGPEADCSGIHWIRLKV